MTLADPAFLVPDAKAPISSGLKGGCFGYLACGRNADMMTWPVCDWQVCNTLTCPTEHMSCVTVISEIFDYHGKMQSFFPLLYKFVKYLSMYLDLWCIYINVFLFSPTVYSTIYI